MMTEKAGTPGTYLLRDIDRGLWHAVRVRAAIDGISLRELILTLLKTYAYGGKTR